MMTTNDIAQEALVTATAAKQQIDSHEEVCAQRYSDILTRLNVIIGGAVTYLLVVVGWLLVYGRPWDKH